MPIYDWTCGEHSWEVMSRIADRDEPSTCPTCSATGRRKITAPNIDKTSAAGWNAQAYNPGLGCWTKNQKHAEQIAKDRGLVPVGNEPVENLEKAAARQKQETYDKRWAEATSEASIREVLG